MTPAEKRPGPGLREPLQERSRDTLERFLAAVESLLAEKTFEEISVADVARKALVDRRLPGVFAPPTAPGLGVTLDERAAAAHPFAEVAPPRPVDSRGRALPW